MLTLFAITKNACIVVAGVVLRAIESMKKEPT